MVAIKINGRTVPEHGGQLGTAGRRRFSAQEEFWEFREEFLWWKDDGVLFAWLYVRRVKRLPTGRLQCGLWRTREFIARGERRLHHLIQEWLVKHDARSLSERREERRESREQAKSALAEVVP